MIENIKETAIPGCFQIKLKVFADMRGHFIKTFHSEEFRKYNLETDYKEEYYSISQKNVLRGMHFQKPPSDHVKIVYCTSGRVQDVLIDLRKESPAFGKHLSFELQANDGQLIYMPKGVAHGFLSLEENSILMYKVSSVHVPQDDCGIRWDSCGILWETTQDLIISDRDKNLNVFSEYKNLW